MHPRRSPRGRGVCSLWALGLVLGPGAATAPGQTPFTEEAYTRGIDYLVYQGGEQFGTGVAFADLNNNGFPDLIVTGALGGAVGVFENDGTGNFIDRTGTVGIAPISSASGVVAADYDGDGYLDLYFSNWFATSRLYRNNGDFTFTDVSVAAGVDVLGPGQGASWGDFDNDGWLDMYVTMRTGTFGSTVQNRLYRNQGDGTFVDVAAAVGVLDPGAPSLLLTWFDYNRNGWADIYLGNDKGSAEAWQNRLWENVGGTFVDVSAASGTGADVDCMGIAVGDFNHNGFQDLYVTNLPVGNKLFINQGDGTFSEETAAAGVEAFRFGWGTLFFDFDNDTHLDIYICNASGGNQLYHGGPVWPLSEVAVPMGVEGSDNSYCVAAADVTGNGALDLLVSSRFQPIRLFINNEGASRRWVKFNVVGRGANTFGVGANVEVVAGGVTQLREVFAGHNYKSSNEMTLHFGMDAALMIDEINIMWPGGTTRTIQNMPTNQTWTLYPPERLGDANGNGVIDASDIRAAFQCLTSGPGSITPGCEIFDMNGDGNIDADDLELMGLGPKTKRLIFIP